jgi:hypothetical protein
MEPPMQPHDTYDLVVNILVLVMMPLIIWANLSARVRQAPLNAYLWRMHPNLMRISLAFLGLLTTFSAIQLLDYFGILPAAATEMTGLVLGIPMLVLSFVVLGLTVGAARKALRDRRGAHKDT